MNAQQHEVLTEFWTGELERSLYSAERARIALANLITNEVVQYPLWEINDECSK